MKRVAGYTAVILTTLALLYLLWQFRLIVILFTISLFVAAAIRPSILRLAAQGMPTWAARLLLYSLIIGSFLLLIYLSSEPFSQEVEVLGNRTAVAYQFHYSRWSTGSEWQQQLVSRLPDPTELFDTAVGEEGEQFLQVLLNLTQTIVGLLGGAITVIILSIYWSTDQDRFERLWLSLLPAASRIRARESWHEVETCVGDYLRSQFVQSLLAAILLGLGYWLMGLYYPLLLAILAAVAWLIPLAGIVLITVPVFVVGLNLSGWVALGAVAYTLLLILFLEYRVERRLFSRRHYSQILLLLTMICLVDAFGFVGFLIAPPLAAAIQVLLRQLFRYWVEPTTTAVHLHQLEQRYEEVRQLYRTNGQDDTYPPEIGSLLQRLEKLLAQARQVA
ncbi:MAG: AI-2E family transporter [Ardenticatenaceae bacterium]|nr:AI-2E family transporter [Ardenticatenaceae bacterium]